MSKGRVKDVLDPKDVKAYGFYKLRGIKKVLFGLAQILPKNIISFKIALILRKITLRNKVKIIDQTQFDLSSGYFQWIIYVTDFCYLCQNFSNMMNSS